MHIEKYLEIKTLSLALHKAHLPFDIFLKLGPAKYTKVFNKNTPLEPERFDSYINKGIKNFHIHKEDWREYNALNEALIKQFRQSQALQNEESLSIIDDFAHQIISEIYSEHLFDSQSLDFSFTLIHTYVDLAKNEFHYLTQLIRLANKKRSHLKHAVSTSIFSVLLARAIDPTQDEFIAHAGLTGLLHDVGTSLLPHSLDEFTNHLSPADTKLLQRHPLHSASILAQAPAFPEKVSTAILQHHERWNGSGYPEGLKGTEISRLARILAVSDDFNLLTSPSESQQALTPQNAIVRMRKSPYLDLNFVDRFAKMLNL